MSAYTFTRAFEKSLQAVEGLGVTRSNLLKLLRSIDTVGWNRREESGRLDRRAFNRFATGEVNIFSRRDYTEAERAAVEVLVDCSSSMEIDGRIFLAQDIAIQLGNIFDKAKVSFAVDGFRSTRSPFEVIPFKQWNESFRKAAKKLGQIGSFACGTTPDYSATQYALSQLATRPEAKKILFLLTDANGYKRAEVEQVKSTAQTLGITIVAVGIGNTEVEDLYTNAVNVRSVRDLAGKAFNALIKAVQK